MVFISTPLWGHSFIFGLTFDLQCLCSTTCIGVLHIRGTKHNISQENLVIEQMCHPVLRLGLTPDGNDLQQPVLSYFLGDVAHVRRGEVDPQAGALGHQSDAIVLPGFSSAPLIITGNMRLSPCNHGFPKPCNTCLSYMSWPK